MKKPAKEPVKETVDKTSEVKKPGPSKAQDNDKTVKTSEKKPTKKKTVFKQPVN